jgi:sugar/nucleoside kinase (ribokinase family)
MYRSHQVIFANINTEKEKKVILVVGACALDRRITVSNFPVEDSKVRSTGYQESCGGNAANVAIAMQKLSNAYLFRSKGFFFTVRLCTKIGSDAAGKQIVKELQDARVDIAAPLFRVAEDTTTSIVHVIVNSSQSKTRTCIFTTGSCGDLTVQDVQSCILGDLFQNVFHIHCDGRHTEAASLIIQEAKQMNPSITISVDSERDRLISEYDQILFAADVIFTNPNSIRDGFLRRLWPNQEAAPLAVAACPCGVCSYLCTPSLYQTSLFFAQNGSCPAKHVVVTLGGKGAISISYPLICHSSETADKSDSTFNVINVHHFPKESRKCYKASSFNYTFEIGLSGILDSTADIVDTTGAGDAFIGAYLLFFLMDQNDSSLMTHSEMSPTCLNFACWASGHKIRGTGFFALPTGSAVDEYLGRTRSEVQLHLAQQLLPFQIVDNDEATCHPKLKSK